MTDRPRKSLQQMAREARAADGADPWACPRCHCKGPHRVETTYDAGGQRKRRRICRNCSQLIRTAEMPVPDGCKLMVVPDDEEESEVAA